MKTKNHSENETSSNSQPEPDQKRSVLWIGLIFFISGWMFFLGVIIGRGTAPAMFDYQKIETEITMLAKTFTESRKAQNDLESDILSTQAGLEYPEELKKKTGDAVKMPMPAMENPIRPTETPKPAAQEPGQSPSPSPAKADLQTAGKPEPVDHAPDAIKPGPEVKIKSMYDIKASQAKETVAERMPAATPERPPVATPKPQVPASDNKAATAQPVAVQLTSLVDKKSADALIESLRSKGISASKTPRMLPGKGVWYTIVIGKYASSAEADAMLNRLKQENVDASLVKP
jgi:cell division septation protein DedD